MSHLPGLVKRLSLAVLGACLLLLGTPLLTITPAHAGTPSGPAVLSFAGHLQGQGSQTFVSAVNDGTNTSITMLVNSSVAGAGNVPIARVDFQWRSTANDLPPYQNWQYIGSASQQPWTVEWNYTNIGNPDKWVQAIAYDVDNNVIGSVISKTFNDNEYAQTAHITHPNQGVISRQGNGQVTLSGTRSSNNPVLYPSSYLRDNSTGAVGPEKSLSSITGAGSWSVSLDPGVCPNTDPSGCDLIFEVGVAGQNGAARSWDSVQGRLRPLGFMQSFTSLAVTPPAVTTNLGTQQQYIVTALDQNGAPMANQNVAITRTATGGNTATVNRTGGISSYDGQVPFTVSDSTFETTTFTATSGTKAVTATFTTAPPTAGTIAAAPAKALYAVPFTGSQAGTGSTGPVGTEVTPSTPVVRMCFTNADGSAIDSSVATNTSRVSASVTRTTKTGSTSTPGSAAAATLTQDQSANPGCYVVAHAAAGSEEEGNDAVTGYYDVDGVAGYQPGTEVQATPVTTFWGQHKLTGSSTPAQISTFGTATFSSKTPDGQSFAGRKLNVAITSPASSTLNPTQPTGTNYVNATTATCLTDSSGTCAVSVTDPNVVTTVLTASDNITDATVSQVATGAWGTAQIAFSLSPPTNGNSTATPGKTVYAMPYTGAQIGIGSTGPVGTEVTASTPVVRMCFTYANGSAIDSSLAANTSKVSASVIRTTKTGSTSTAGSSAAVTLTQDQSANPGCYVMAHAAAGSEEEGSDGFTGYYNADGVAGYQPGTDVQATPVTTSWGQHKLTGSTGSAQISTFGTAVFSSKTPDGQSFAGRKLNVVITSPASSTLNTTQPTGTTYVNATTATCVTTSAGTCSVSVTDPNAVTTTLTASDNITDATLGQVATGGWGTAQIAFNLAPPTTGVFTSTPAKTLYAAPFTGTLTGTGSTTPVGSEYAASSQTSRVCFTYSGGSPIDSSNGTAASKVFVVATRTTKTGSTSTTGAATPVTLTQDQSANPGCFVVPHPAAGAEDEGSDAFTGYYNTDGVAGYQPGNGDVGVTPTTVSWGQLKTTGSTTTGLKGRFATATYTSKTPDGQSFIGRKLTLTVTSPASSTLNPTQPVGTTYLTATTATCVTDNNGGCGVSVTDANSVSTVITASDNITDATLAQIATGGWGTAGIAFTSVPGGLDTVSSPLITLLQPAVNVSGNRLRPGDIGHYSPTLLDNNGAPLPNKTVALTLSQGYFTPDCTSYPTCTFTPAPADGNTTGAASSLGQSLNVTSDANGVFTFATSIARDSKLDATGQLAVNLTVIGANGAATALLTPFSTLGAALANASSLTIVPLTSSDALSGNVAGNGSNKILGQAGLLAIPGSNFQLRLTDGFGNLATLSTCAVNLSLSPLGPQSTGSAPYLGSPGNSSANGCGSFTTTAPLNGVPPETFHIDSDNPSTVPNATTLTASWPIPWTRYTAVAGPPATTYTTTAGSAAPVVASKQLSLYAIDQTQLRTTMSQTPGTTVLINTAVSVTAKVTDQVGNPVTGLNVSWQRSGPNDATGAPQTIGGASTTSSAGAATFGFTSPTTGTATITAIGKNAMGTELTRGASNTTFTASPAPTGSPTPTSTPTASPVPTPTGSGTPTPTATPSATPTGSPVSTPTPTPTATPTPTGLPGPGAAVTITGGDWQQPVFGTTFTLTGTAPAGSVVTLRFHKSGTPAGSYGVIRTLTTPASGTWTRPIAAIFDYRYYATLATTSGLVTSGTVLFQPSPLIDGPLNITMAKNQNYTITGQAAPYSLVYLHFHRNGTPAVDYSVVRPVRTDKNGKWSRPILASIDYRYYISRTPNDAPAGQPTYWSIAR